MATFGVLLVLWALCNPFYGIDASNLVYMSRALADLDSGGVGRDAMFVHDGQSGFTIFTTLFRRLAQTTGLSSAGTLVAACAVASAFLGASGLACALAKGSSRWLIIAFAAALPARYGGYKLFAYAHPLAASGVALLAAWLVVEDRRWFVPLGLAAAWVVGLAMVGSRRSTGWRSSSIPTGPQSSGTAARSFSRRSGSTDGLDGSSCASPRC